MTSIIGSGGILYTIWTVGAEEARPRLLSLPLATPAEVLQPCGSRPSPSSSMLCIG